VEGTAGTGLRQVAGRRTLGFSQGERTKVALARALVHDPQRLLLDEAANGSTSPPCAACGRSCSACERRVAASSFAPTTARQPCATGELYPYSYTSTDDVERMLNRR
jgi:hypothetical protein